MSIELLSLKSLILQVGLVLSNTSFAASTISFFVLSFSLSFSSLVIEDRMKGRQYGLAALATHRWRSLFAFFTNTLDMSARHIAVDKNNSA